MILTFIEETGGEVLDASLGIIDFARELTSSKQEVIGLLMGTELKELSSQLEDSNLDKVLLFQDQRLKKYAPKACARVLAQVIEDHSPQVVLAGHTSMGSDLFSRVASILDVGMASECVAVENKDGKLNITKSVFGGSLLARVKLKSTPYLLTLKPSQFPPGELESDNRGVEIEELKVSIPDDLLRLQVKELEKPAQEGASLTEAEKVVAGGRGVGSEEDFKLLQELADILGGAVGGTRVAVDNGWLLPDNQVGQTGKTIAPELYLACGISGAIQHMVGCKDSKIIVAINKDPDAPIFARSDYGIVGDLFEVIPELTKGLKE